MTDLDFLSMSDVESAIHRVEALLSCGIFQVQCSKDILFRAAFIEILIALR